MFTLTITDKKEIFQITVSAEGEGTVTMSGQENTRVHIYGTKGVSYAVGGPVPFACAEAAKLLWGVVGKHGIYINHLIQLTRVDGGLKVEFRVRESQTPLFETVLTSDVPAKYTLYRYGGEQRSRRE